jgi:hypothetical protein
MTIPTMINMHPDKDIFVGISLKKKYPPQTDVSVLDPAQNTVIVFKEYARMLTGYTMKANPSIVRPDNKL